MTTLLPLGYAPSALGGVAGGIGGLYIPPFSMDRWWCQPQVGVKHVVVAGDSIPQGTFMAASPAVQVGGMDAYPLRLARALQSILGPCVGAGYQGLWRSDNLLAWGNSASEWSIAGAAPTQSLNSGFVVAPHGSSYFPASGAANQFIYTPQVNKAARQVVDAVFTAGSTTVQSASAAFTAAGDQGAAIFGPLVPRDTYIVGVTDGTHAVMSNPPLGGGSSQALSLLGRNPVIGGIAQVDLLWCDASLITQTSTSVDGGGTWQNTAAPTNPATAILRKTSIANALASGFRTRGANAAGTAQALNALSGLVLYNTAAPTTGFVVHNLGCDGQALTGTFGNLGFLSGLGVSGGDPLLLLDNKGIAASTGSLQPSLLIVNYSNDVLDSPAQLLADITSLCSRVGGYCDILIVIPHEENRLPFATVQTQALIRQTWRQGAFANNCAVLDMDENFAQLAGAYGARGWPAYTAAGLLQSDGVHLTPRGHNAYASAILRALNTSAGL